MVAELYIDRGDQTENKFIFDRLLENKDEIENVFGGQLVWVWLDEKRASRIKCEMPANVSESDTWPKMIEFMTDAMVRLEKSIKVPLAAINTELKAK